VGNVVTMNTIVLRGIATDLTSATGHQWVVDCCRAGEGLCSDQDLQAKWEIPPDEFEKISKNPALIRAVRAESELRVRRGIAAKEAACKHWAKAPKILDEIASSEQSGVRGRIEAIRELRTTALGNNGDGSAADNSERITISINMGGDVEVYEKTITPKPPMIESKTDGDE
jgi:hypothetical protein